MTEDQYNDQISRLVGANLKSSGSMSIDLWQEKLIHFHVNALRDAISEIISKEEWAPPLATIIGLCRTKSGRYVEKKDAPPKCKTCNGTGWRMVGTGNPNYQTAADRCDCWRMRKVLVDRKRERSL